MASLDTNVPVRYLVRNDERPSSFSYLRPRSHPYPRHRSALTPVRLSPRNIHPDNRTGRTGRQASDFAQRKQLYEDEAVLVH
jgi:hypothetical protein